MTGGITILTLEQRDEWQNAVARGELPGQSWNYAFGLSASGMDPRLAVLEVPGAYMVVPFFEREFMGARDIVTLPGLSGASIMGDSIGALNIWQEFARSQGWIAGYIQLSNATEIDAVSGDNSIAVHNEVFLFDLHSWDPAASASRTIRRKIVTAETGGAELLVQAPELLEALLRLYPGTLERTGARPQFSDGTIRRWATMNSSVLVGVIKDGVIEAVHLGYVEGETAEWHLAATTEEGRSLATLIYWKAPQILRARGARYYNMGGGNRIGDGIWEFKSRMGGVRTPLRSLRQIYDVAKYNELVKVAGVPPQEAWFPAYRASIDRK